MKNFLTQEENDKFLEIKWEILQYEGIATDKNQLTIYLSPIFRHVLLDYLTKELDIKVIYMTKEELIRSGKEFSIIWKRKALGGN